MATLLTRKGELEQEGAGAECDSRVRFITNALDTADSAIGDFDEGIVCQTVASITVLDAERLSIRFKDGTEIEQIIESRRRASA